MKRGLNAEFIKDLTDGVLKDCLDHVRSNKDLILEIRGNYINIYYRGGNVFRIAPVRQGRNGYRIFWDKKYQKKYDGEIVVNLKVLKDGISDRESCLVCVDEIPKILKVMDAFFVTSPKKEKFIQQEMVTTKVLSDYVLTDFEYQKGNRARFDLMGVKLLEAKSMMSFIELKQGYKSLRTKTYTRNGIDKQTSGLKKHMEDILLELEPASEANKDLRESSDKISDEIKQAREIYAQKLGMSLLSDAKFPDNVKANEIEVLFVIADYMKRGSNRFSSYLGEEVKSIEKFLTGKTFSYKLKVNLMFLETKNCKYNIEIINKSESADLLEWENLLRSFYKI